jgi:IclR helix-turn-helix domain
VPGAAVLLVESRWPVGSEVLGAVDERPVCVRLTAEQVELVIHAVQSGNGASLAALLAGRVSRYGIPPIAVWEEHAQGATIESRFSLALVRGLLLLAHLASGQPARLKDLAVELNLAPSTTRTYLRTLLIARLIEQDPDTRLYKLAT